MCVCSWGSFPYLKLGGGVCPVNLRTVIVTPHAGLLGQLHSSCWEDDLLGFHASPTPKPRGNVQNAQSHKPSILKLQDLSGKGFPSSIQGERRSPQSENGGYTSRHIACSGKKEENVVEQTCICPHLQILHHCYPNTAHILNYRGFFQAGKLAFLSSVQEGGYLKLYLETDTLLF